LPNPALQALCKLITASETGEQLISRVSWEVFLQYQFPNGSSQVSKFRNAQNGLCPGLSTQSLLGYFRVEILNLPVCVNESVCPEEKNAGMLLGCMALGLLIQ